MKPRGRHVIMPSDELVIKTYMELKTLSKTSQKLGPRPRPYWLSKRLKANGIEVVNSTRNNEKTCCFDCNKGWAKGCVFIRSKSGLEKGALDKIGAVYVTHTDSYRVVDCPQYEKGSLPPL